MALAVLQQLRFLDEIVDENNFLAKLKKLLKFSPEIFARDVVLFLPDIVKDTQHDVTAELLINKAEQEPRLTSAILDCVNNLSLEADFREKLRSKVLLLLEKEMELSCLSSITRYNFVFDMKKFIPLSLFEFVQETKKSMILDSF